jgi:hypothetical protein
MTKKEVEKSKVVPPAAQAQPSIEKPDVSQPQVEGGQPKTLSPRDRVVVPATREEFQRLSEGAPEGSLLKDSRILRLVNAVDESGRHVIPDWRFDLFSWAVVHLPGDISDMLDRMDGKAGAFQDPRKTVADFLGKRRNLSFCIHPLTGDALISGTQKGHPQMFNEAQVPADMRSHFCLGAVYLREGKMVVNQHADLTRLNSGESDKVTLRILKEDFGISSEVVIHDQAPHLKSRETLIERGMTPRGQPIPHWDDSQPSLGVIFEGGFCYTRIPISIDVGNMRGIHTRATRYLSNRLPGGLEIFNNIEGHRGKFLNVDLPSLSDGSTMQVTGGDSCVILRTQAKGTEIPHSLENARDVISKINAGIIGLGE